MTGPDFYGNQKFLTGGILAQRTAAFTSRRAMPAKCCAWARRRAPC